MNILDILKTLLFGAVEGIAEWLPISSTGHLILLGELMPLPMTPEFYEMFEVVIQLGAILAVFVCFGSRLSVFTKEKKERKNALKLWKMAAVGVIPSAVAGFFLDDILDEYFYSATTVAIMLIVYGIAFIVVERIKMEKDLGVSRAEDMTFRHAFAVGLFQILALIPGTSRSGATILGGMLIGLSRSAAAEYSFFLAIPTMLGAGGLKIVKLLVSSAQVSRDEMLMLLLGCASAFAVSCVTIRFLTDFVKRHSFCAFGIYRIIFGGGLLIWFCIK